MIHLQIEKKGGNKSEPFESLSNKKDKTKQTKTFIKKYIYIHSRLCILLIPHFETEMSQNLLKAS